jgi:hypothetical protein
MLSRYFKVVGEIFEVGGYFSAQRVKNISAADENDNHIHYTVKPALKDTSI